MRAGSLAAGLLMVLMAGAALAAAQEASPTSSGTASSSSSSVEIAAGPKVQRGAQVQQHIPMDWLVAPKHSIAVNNMPCSPTLTAHGHQALNVTGEPACRVCGGPAALAAACVQDKRCVAFVVDERDPSCGVLKVAADKQFRSETHNIYCYSPRSQACTGRFSFAPGQGMPFSGDYKCHYTLKRVEQPYCYAPGGIIEAAKACINDERCNAFTHHAEQSSVAGGSRGAFLKDSAGRARPQPGSDVYWRL